MAEGYYEEALSLYRQGQFFDCLERCEKGLAATPGEPRLLHLLGLLCFKGGDVNLAADYLEQSVKADPSSAEVYFNLGLMRKRQGNVPAALENYRKGVELDDSDAQGQFNFGLALWQTGDAAAAAPPLRRAVELNPMLKDGYNTLGVVEAELGRTVQSEECFRKALASRPDDLSACRNLAQLLKRQARLGEAVDILEWGMVLHGPVGLARELAALHEEAGRLDEAAGLLGQFLAARPDEAQARESLGVIYFKQGRYAESLAELQASVAADAGRAEAHMRIFMVAQILGQPELALEHQRQALALGRVFTETGPDAAKPSLTILKAPGDWQINLPTDFIIRTRDWSAVHQFYVGDGNDPFQHLMVPRADALLNAVAEPDRAPAELATAAKLAALLGCPVINDPLKVAATGRDSVALLLAGLPHAVIPATFRLEAKDAQAALESLLADGRLRLPVLVRPAGTHAGNGLTLCTKPEELPAALAEAAARGDVYVSQYVDYAGADGQYRKYRVVVVDGKPYPFHLAVSRRWMVHYYNAEPDDAEAMRREEETFLAEFGTVFAQPLQDAFTEMRRRLGLDIFVVDCAILEDGRLLLFEVDVGAVVHAMDDPKAFAYKHRYVPRIFDAFEAMIKSRIAAASKTVQPAGA